MPSGNLREFLMLCVQGAQGHVAQIEAFLAAGDRQGVAREAHMLVSVAGNVGAMQLSALARKAEIAALSDPARVAAAVTRLKACLEVSLSALEAEIRMAGRVPGQDPSQKATA